MTWNTDRRFVRRILLSCDCFESRVRIHITWSQFSLKSETTKWSEERREKRERLCSCVSLPVSASCFFFASLLSTASFSLLLFPAIIHPLPLLRVHRASVLEPLLTSFYYLINRSCESWETRQQRKERVILQKMVRELLQLKGLSVYQHYYSSLYLTSAPVIYTQLLHPLSSWCPMTTTRPLPYFSPEPLPTQVQYSRPRLVTHSRTRLPGWGVGKMCPWINGKVSLSLCKRQVNPVVVGDCVCDSFSDFVVAVSFFFIIFTDGHLFSQLCLSFFSRLFFRLQSLFSLYDTLSPSFLSFLLIERRVFMSHHLVVVNSAFSRVVGECAAESELSLYSLLLTLHFLLLMMVR